MDGEISTADVVQTGPESKRRRLTELTQRSDSKAESLEQDVVESLADSGEPTCPQTWPYWLAIDLVTAGRQGAELGRDQTPIVQISAVLGQFEDAKILDRFILDLRPEAYVKSSLNTTNSVSATDIDPKLLATLRDPLSGVPWLGGAVISEEESAAKHELVSISHEAMRVAHWEENSGYPDENAPSLSEAMNIFADWLRSFNIPVGQEPETGSLIIITDGHSPLRNVLHAQAAYIGIDQKLMERTPWSSYVNVMDWCKQSMANLTNITSPSLSDALTVFNLDTKETTIRKVDQIAKLVLHLIHEGIPPSDPQTIRCVYEHRVFSRKLQLDDKEVVELRQVPWSATPSTIAGFFSGLNVIPGGVAIRLTDGRRSNTALVAFESDLDAQLAMTRHHHQLAGALLPDSMVDLNGHQTDKSVKDNQSPTNASKPILLQVSPASAKEFVQCAGCDQANVSEFLKQLTNGEQVVVRVRGLPYTTTKQKILEFFAAVQAYVLMNEQGIFLVAYPEGRPTGDAFVLFDDDKMATRALLRHKDYLGDRYVELFKASPSEMVQVCHNVSQQLFSPSSVNKNQSSLLDGQNRTPIVMNTNPSVASLNAYLLQLQQQHQATLPQIAPGLTFNPLSTVQFNPNLLSQNVAALNSPQFILPSNQLDALNSINTDVRTTSVLPNGLSPHCTSAQLLLSSPTTTTSLSTTTNSTNLILNPYTGHNHVVAHDLKDPTDPDCPYARPIPASGVNAMIQMSGLPLETSRHDIRLYLGPVNMAKVYRLRKVDIKPNQTASNWLLSVLNTTEALQLIRYLINRPFTVGNSLNGNAPTCVIPNCPTFSLYHVTAEKSVQPISLADPCMGVPYNRICGFQSGDQQQLQANETYPIASSSTETNSLGMDSIIQNFMTHSQSTCPNQPQASIFTNTANTSAVPIQLGALGVLPQLLSKTTHAPALTSAAVLNQQHLQSRFNPPMHHNGIERLLNNETQSAMSPAAHSFMVMLVGTPLDVTTEELNSLFQPVLHLLSASPQFTLLEAQANGTANYLATFRTALEAQLASVCCSIASLRRHQFPISVIPLSAPAPINIQTELPTRAYNPFLANLILGGGSTHLPSTNLLL